MPKLSRLLIMILSIATICLAIVLGPSLFMLVLSWQIDLSMIAFFTVIFACVFVYILVREHLIFGVEEREEKKD